jgi:FlaA1/EpsC-like NDP-sugar epimerase
MRLAAWVRKPIPAPLHGLIDPSKLAFDLFAWVFAVGLATRVRLEISDSGVPLGAVLRAMAFFAVSQLVVGIAFGLYRGRWRYGSFDEVAALLRTTVVASFVAFLAERPFRPRTPLSALFVGSCVALLMMISVRYLWRLALDVRRRPDPDQAQRLLIYGAGDRGAGIIDDLLRDKSSRYVPVALIDDDPAKRRLSVRGVRVQGSGTSIELLAREHRASALLVAMSDVSQELMGRVLTAADRCEPPLAVKVLSPLSGLFGEGAHASQIQDLTEEDLLGRRRVETDLTAMAGYIRGKRVLVTGAGGSIGSELCRQLVHFHPAALLMLDRDESALHGVQLSIEGRALLDSSDLILADLRDGDRMMRVFMEHRPQVVFHAAALKHLTLLERHPAEAVKSNVWGTQTVLDAAMAVGVERFVNISTDKAADPSCVLGYSKRLAERLTAEAAVRASSGTYVSVRFGNVLGSRGSVLTTFRSQIAEGGPVTVTDPEVTRFFMLVAEAVQLVIQAGAIGRPGEVLVLDMGEPVRIDDVARALIRRSRRPIDLTYTGLRPGEKMHEVLLGPGEDDVRPLHPLVSHANVPPISPDVTAAIDTDAPTPEIIGELADLSRRGTSVATP